MSHPYRRESMARLFKTPEVKRGGSQHKSGHNQTRVQGRRQSGFGGTPLVEPDSPKVDLIDVETVWRTLELIGMRRPNNIARPPSNNLVREMFGKLFTTIVEDSDDSLPGGPAILVNLDALGYQEDRARLNRVLQRQVFIANTPENWELIFPAVLFLVNIKRACDEVVSAPIDAGLETLDKMLAWLSVNKSTNIHADGPAEYAHNLRQVKARKEQSERERLVKKKNLLDEIDEQNELDKKRRDAQNDADYVNKFHVEMNAHLPNLGKELDDSTAKFNLLQVQDSELEKTEKESEAQIKSKGRSLTELQRMSSDKDELQQKVVRVTDSITELKSQRQALVDASILERHEIMVVFEECALHLETQTKDGPLIEPFQHLSIQFNQELDKTKKTEMALDRKVEDDRVLREEASTRRDAIRESNGHLQVKVMVLLADCERLEDALKTRRRNIYSQREAEIAELEGVHLEHVKQGKLLNSQVEIKEKEGNLAGRELNGTVNPLLEQMRHKGQVLDRYTSDIAPYVAKIHNLAQNCVKMAEKSAKKLSTLSPVPLPVVYEKEAIVDMAKAAYQAEIDKIMNDGA